MQKIDGVNQPGAMITAARGNIYSEIDSAALGTKVMPAVSELCFPTSYRCDVHSNCCGQNGMGC